MALDECEADEEADTVWAWLPLGLDDGAPEAVPVQLGVGPGLGELELDTLPVIEVVLENVARWLDVPVVEGDGEKLGEGEELREDVSLLLRLCVLLRVVDPLAVWSCERLSEQEGELDADGVPVELEDCDCEGEPGADTVDDPNG